MIIFFTNPHHKQEKMKSTWINPDQPLYGVCISNIKFPYKDFADCSQNYENKIEIFGFGLHSLKANNFQSTDNEENTFTNSLQHSKFYILFQESQHAHDYMMHSRWLKRRKNLCSKKIVELANGIHGIQILQYFASVHYIWLLDFLDGGLLFYQEWHFNYITVGEESGQG